MFLAGIVMFHHAYLTHGNPQTTACLSRSNDGRAQYGTFELNYEKFQVLEEVVEITEMDEHEEESLKRILHKMTHVFREWDFGKRHSLYRVVGYLIMVLNIISVGGAFRYFCRNPVIF